MNIEEKIRQFRKEVEHICAPYPLPSNSHDRLMAKKIIKRAIGNDKKMKKLWGALQKEAGVHATFHFDLAGGATTHSPANYVSEGKLYPFPGQVFIVLLEGLEGEIAMTHTFLHEMRHALQIISGFLSPPRQASLLDTVWFTRVIEADAESFNAIQLLQLGLDGDTEPFEYAEAGQFGTIYDAIIEMYQKDPTTLNDGRLRRVAFDAWFSIPTVGINYECESLRSYAIEKEFYQRFEKQGQVFHDTPLTAKYLEALGTLDSDEPNYLTLPGFRSLDDPYYRFNFASKEVKKLWAEECAKTAQTPKKPLPKLG